MRNGQGVFSGYSGEWQDDQKSGYGVEIREKEGKYEGEFRGGVKEGDGLYMWEDGSYGIQGFFVNFTSNHITMDSGREMRCMGSDCL